MTRVRLVLLDVDFTILYPSDVFSGPGYAALAQGYGLALDPGRYDAARELAREQLWGEERSLDHDELEHTAFTRMIVEGMGGCGTLAETVADAAASEWNDPANFALNDDVRPLMARLHEAGIPVGLVSNTHRELAEFMDVFDLDVSFALSSRAHGRVKPCPTIFAAALALAGVPAASAIMVGDSPGADVRGALAAGLGGVLLDRDGVYADAGLERIGSLGELPALLELS
jgi:putative hydrolase of the HAD superfamily